MSNHHDPAAWDRLARGTGVTGLLTIPLVFVPTIALATLGEPPLDAGVDETVAFVTNLAESSWAPVATVLQAVAVLVLLWWAAAFTHLMRRAEGEPSWRATAALASMVIFAGQVVLESSFQAAVHMGNPEPELALFAFEAGNLGFANSWLALGSFAVASGWVIVSTHRLPPVLGWLAVVSGAGFVVARVVWTTSFWLAPYAAFWIWFAAVCVTLMRTSSGSASLQRRRQ